MAISDRLKPGLRSFTRAWKRDRAGEAIGSAGGPPERRAETPEAQSLTPLLTSLFEAPGLPLHDLPPRLAELHDGGLGFSGRKLYANFVTSLDGITAVDPGAAGQGRVISGGVVADRFLMGLLRAFAAVILVGAGTLRAEREHVWTPEHVYPDLAADFAQLRSELGLAAQPPLAVVTASGDIDPTLPALAGGFVIANAVGAKRLRACAPEGVTVLEAGTAARLEAGDVVATLRTAVEGSILTEGGPHLFGQLLAAGLVDELFLTLSPVLAGRSVAGSQIGLVEGAELLPGMGAWGRLMSVHQGDSHLFLRYALGESRQPRGGARC